MKIYTGELWMYQGNHGISSAFVLSTFEDIITLAKTYIRTKNMENLTHGYFDQIIIDGDDKHLVRHNLTEKLQEYGRLCQAAV